MMPARHLSDDELLDLVAGLGPLDGAEMRAHARSCAACEQRLRGVVRDFELARSLRPATIPDVEAPTAKTGDAAPATRRAVVWSIAGLAAAVLIGLVLLRQPRGMALPQDGLDYWLPDDHAIAEWRSTGSKSDADLARAALEAYRLRQTRRVVALLRPWPFPKASFPEAGEPFEHLRLVLASALVWEGEDAAALQEIATLRVETLPHPYRDRARWIEFVALLRSGKRSAARDVALSLSARPGEFQQLASAALATL